jgi:hypothetical protein
MSTAILYIYSKQKNLILNSFGLSSHRLAALVTSQGDVKWEEGFIAIVF